MKSESRDTLDLQASVGLVPTSQSWELLTTALHLRFEEGDKAHLRLTWLVLAVNDCS